MKRESKIHRFGKSCEAVFCENLGRALPIVFAVAAASAAACATLYHIDDYTTGSAADGSVDAAGDGSVADTFVGNDAPSDLGSDGGVVDSAPEDADVKPPECTTNAECTARATAAGALDAGPDASPDAPPIGVLPDGTAPSVCLQPEGRCVRLLSADCPTVTGDYTNDNAIVVGTLFSITGSTGATNLARQSSATLAVEEIDSALGGGGIPPAVAGGPRRPLVAVSCDEVNLLSAGAHLVGDLHVPAIVGPNTSQDALDLTVKVSATGGTLLMTPTAVASAIASLADSDLTWRDVPSDLQRAKLMMQQIGDLETALHATVGANVKLAIVYRNDALGQSTFASISGALKINGKPLTDPANTAFVKINAYDPKVVSTETDIATALTTFKPDIVTIFGTAESVTNVLVPLEKGLGAAGANLPQYVLIDSNKVKELLAALSTAGVPADLRMRVRGTGVTPNAASLPIFAAFNGAYTARYGSNPGISGMGGSYDALYSIAYALAATSKQTVSGASVAKGLRMLASGPTIDVGASKVLSGFQQLAETGSMTLVGTFGPLAWDTNGDILGGTIEMWCIGGGATPGFGSSGLTMDVPTQVIGGTYVQCK